MRDTTLPDWATLAPSAFHGLATLVRTLAFWTAALLPLLYVPVVLVDHAVVADPTVLGTLVALNVAALFVGHRYGDAVGEDVDSDAGG